MDQNPPSVVKTVSESVPYAVRYTDTLNSIFSGLAFSNGLASVSTENPSFYATISLLFIFTLWISMVQPYKKRLGILRVAKHPASNRMAMLQRTVPFIMGWMFLGSVALGMFDKFGWAGQSYLR